MSAHISRLVAAGESDILDYKQSITDAGKIAKTLSAFSNSKGGTLLIGVKDNRRISGVRSEDEKYMVDLAARFYTNPVVDLQITEWELGGKVVLECFVQKGLDQPYFAKGEDNKWWAYVRVGDQTLLAGQVALGVMKRKSQLGGSLIQYNDPEKLLFAYLAENDEITVYQFRKMARISRWKAIRILINLVSAGVIILNRREKDEYFTLS